MYACGPSYSALADTCLLSGHRLELHVVADPDVAIAHTFRLAVIAPDGRTVVGEANVTSTRGLDAGAEFLLSLMDAA